MDMMALFRGGPHIVLTLGFILTWTRLSESLAVILGGLDGSREVEFCQWEQVDVMCDEGRIVIVEEALHGHMAVGKCIDEPFDDLGCSTNVFDWVDAWCSGRNSCNFGFDILQQIQNCSTVYSSYLRMRYTCIDVESCHAPFCENANYQVRLSENTGVLSSWVASHVGCGNGNCPWMIESLPGQRINITLIDFSHPRIHERLSPHNQCQRFAKISEEDFSKDITTCSSDYSREKHIYLSAKNSILLEMITAGSHGEIQYLIVYEIVGCGEPNVPAFATADRHGDKANLQCDASGEQWTLTCQGSEWVGDTHKICPVGQPGGKAPDSAGGAKKSPYGLLVVIGLGVALGVVIGVILLGIALLYMRRRSKRRNRQPRNTLLCDQSPMRDPHKSGMIIHESSPLSRGGGTLIYTPEHDYTTTLHPKRALPVPSPSIPADSSQTHVMEHFQCNECAAAQTGPNDFNINHATGKPHGKHMYETPSFPFQQMTLGGAGGRMHSSDALALHSEQEESRRTN